MVRNATTGFVAKILDFCDDNFPLLPPEALAEMSAGERRAYEAKMVQQDKLVAYAQAHIPIAQKNAVNAAMSVIAARGQSSLPPEGGLPGAAAATAAPVGSSPMGGGAPAPLQPAAAPAGAPMA